MVCEAERTKSDFLNISQRWGKDSDCQSIFFYKKQARKITSEEVCKVPEGSRYVPIRRRYFHDSDPYLSQDPDPDPHQDLKGKD